MVLLALELDGVLFNLFDVFCAVLALKLRPRLEMRVAPHDVLCPSKATERPNAVIF